MSYHAMPLTGTIILRGISANERIWKFFSDLGYEFDIEENVVNIYKDGRAIRYCVDDFDEIDNVVKEGEVLFLGEENELFRLVWENGKHQVLFDNDEKSKGEETITLSIIDGGQTVWVTSGDDPNGIERELSNGDVSLIQALCEFLEKKGV